MTPYYTDDSVTLYHGDCLEVLPTLPDNSVDAVVTDPPYALNFMGREWDKFAGYVERNGSSRALGDDGGRHDEGYRNMRGREHEYQAWCGQWAGECLRILKPGGHLLAFGGTRTSHRLTCGIEDAGFEIRDGKVWLYGSGFPKSLNVGRAIDGMFCREAGTHSDDPEHVCLLTPQGDGWRGYGTALKPAHEPICMARKPLTGTVAANVLRWGTGALNIDGCRIDGADAIAGRVRHGGGSNQVYASDEWTKANQATMGGPMPAGRWPANVALDESQAAALDQMSGELVSGSGAVKRASSADELGNQGAAYGAESRAAGTPMISHADTGGASRFFYAAKASSDERITHNDTAHPTVKPLSLMRWLVRLVTPPGGTILEPFAGSGTTVEAALLEGFRCIAIEREAEYLPLVTQRINRRRDPIAYLTAAGDDLGLFGDDEGAA